MNIKLKKSKMVSVSSRFSRQLVCGQAKRGPQLTFLDKKMNDFVMEFNKNTKPQEGKKITVKFLLYNNGTYRYTVGHEPSTDLLKKIVGNKKEISESQLLNLAKQELSNLNTQDISKAVKTLLGTANSMGIKINSD